MTSRTARILSATIASIAVAGAVAGCSSSDNSTAGPTPLTFTASLNGANERPNVIATTATGTASIVVNGATASYTVTVNGLSGAPTASHIHGPADANSAAAVIVGLNASAVTGPSGTFSGTFTSADIVGQGGAAAISMDSLVTLLKNGRAYVNVHTSLNKAGEIRGQLNLQ